MRHGSYTLKVCSTWKEKVWCYYSRLCVNVRVYESWITWEEMEKALKRLKINESDLMTTKNLNTKSWLVLNGKRKCVRCATLQCTFQTLLEWHTKWVFFMKFWIFPNFLENPKFCFFSKYYFLLEISEKLSTYSNYEFLQLKNKKSAINASENNFKIC